MSQSPTLAELHAKALDLVAAIDLYLQAHSSPRLAHHRPSFLLAAIERELEAAAATPKHDAHTLAMAKQLDITPEAFLELQEDRRKGMR